MHIELYDYIIINNQIVQNKILNGGRMNYFKIRSLLFCLFIMFSFFSSSCTVIGLVSGLAIDSKNKAETFDGGEFTKLEIGDSIQIVKKDRLKIKGIYKGIKIVLKENYPLIQEQNTRSKASFNLPGMGDSIQVRTKTNMTNWYKYLGFRPEYIMTERINSNQSMHIKYDNIDEILNTEHSQINVDSLRSLAVNSNEFYDRKIILFPFFSFEETLIETQEIETITILRKETNYKNSLAISGLVLDILVILQITREIRN